VIFTNPQVAVVGLTEQGARAQGRLVKSAAIPLDMVPRAQVDHATTGLVKMIAEETTNRVLGVQMVAENAGDVIYAATLAVKYGLTIEDLVDSFAPYLTMSESLKLAAQSFDKDVHKLSCCAA
jgi:mercuric reductase